MPDIEAKIAERVDAFVAELRELVRQAALEAVTEVLEQPTSRGPRRGAPGRRTAGRAATGASAGAGKTGANQARARRSAGGDKRTGSRKRKGSRRSAEDIAEQADMVQRVVRDNPDGVRADQISAALGIDTSELVLPIKKLLGDKAIRRSGQRRATRYFPK